MASTDIPLTIEEPGVLPKERFRDYSDATELCGQILDADKVRAEWRTTVQKIHDGNALYSKEDLEKSGQGWRCRTNFRGMEGLVQTVGTSIYNLDVEVDKCVEIGLDYGKGVERNDWQAKIEENFTWLVMKKWKGFDYHVQMRIRQMVLHGLGHHINEMNNSWIPRTLPMGHLLFPEDTPINFDEEGEFAMVRDFWTMDRLYRAIENESAAAKMGWNPKVVWKAMAEIGKSAGASDPERFQQLYKQGDIQSSNTRRAGIYLNFLYVQEFETGKISLYILPEKADMGGYFFVKRNLFESWSDIINLFPYDIGNGTLQSLRGIGARTKEFFEMENRLLNAAADQMLFASTMPMQQDGAELDKDKLRLLRLGVLSILPDGIKPVTGLQFQNVSAGLVALRNELKGGIAENNQSYMTSAPEQKDRQTYLEYAMRSQDANKVNKGTHNLYYRNLTQFYWGMLSRLSKTKETGDSLASRLAKEFFARCDKDGIPREAFNHIEEVTAVRSIGAGSAAARLQAQLMLMQYIYPTATTDRKINLERDLTASLTSFSAVDRYARNSEDNDLVSQDESFATLENDVLAQGGMARAAERQDHVMHLATHLAKGEEVNQTYLNQQIPAQPAYAAITALGEHCAEHLKQLEGIRSRQDEFRQLYARWQTLSKDADRIQRELEAQQDQPDAEQRLSEDGQVKMAKVEMDAQIKAKKAELDEQRKARKAQFTEALADARTASQIRKQQ